MGGEDVLDEIKCFVTIVQLYPTPCTAICPLTVSELVLSDENTIYHRHDMSEYCHPTTFMPSPSSPFLTHSESEHYDEIERDDELWTQYVSIAADADKQMIDGWMKLVDTILVFACFSIMM